MTLTTPKAVQTIPSMASIPPHDRLPFVLYCALDQENAVEDPEDDMPCSWADLDPNERDWFRACVTAVLEDPGLIHRCLAGKSAPGDEVLGHAAADETTNSSHDPARGDVDRARDELAGLLYLTMERLDFGPDCDHFIHPWCDTSRGIKAGYLRYADALLAHLPASSAALET